MTVRTIPSIFPLVRRQELQTYKPVRSSVIRKLAQMQNWIWSKFVRVYAGHGYEGMGNDQIHIGTTYYSGFVEGGAVEKVKLSNNNDILALPLASFVVPPHWGASRRVRIQGRTNLTSALGSGFSIIVGVFTLDEVALNIWDSVTSTTTGNTDWDLELAVPQDKMYQIKVYQNFTDASTNAANDAGEAVYTSHVSARYAEANASEIGGMSVPSSWQPTADLPATADETMNAAILRRVLDNTLHLYTQRGPELCQSWLGKCNARTGTYEEVGRYKIWCPQGITAVVGNLIVDIGSIPGAYTHGGVQNVRVLLDGVVVYTSATLNTTGIHNLSVASFAVSDAAEHVITIEARCQSTHTASMVTGDAAGWGARVNGVSFWEETVTMNLPGGTTVPAAFQPLDEAGLDGDDPICATTNSFAQKSGLIYLIQNDRWLFRHRIRHLIGDWRGRAYKRAAVFDAPNQTNVDPRSDWTRGEYGAVSLPGYSMGRPRNLTVRGDADADNDVDGYGGYQYGLADTATGYLMAGPYVYPLILDFDITGIHGRRLAKHQIVVPTATLTHLYEESGWVCLIRGRRLQPYQMGNDESGNGPAANEETHKLKAYFVPKYNTTAQSSVPILGRNEKVLDFNRHWAPPSHGVHGIATTTFSVNGRLPPQAQTASGTAGGGKSQEGMFFEVELNSMYLADEPLSTTVLEALA